MAQVFLDTYFDGFNTAAIKNLGNPTFETKLAGNLTVQLDEKAVEEAVSFLSALNLFVPTKSRIIAGQEL